MRNSVSRPTARTILEAPLRGLALGLVVGFFATRAQAEPTPEDRSLATALFQKARTLVQDGNDAEACPLFEESQRLDPGGGTLLNLALCHERIGRTGSAWTELTEARGIARREADQERVALAEEHLEALRAKLSMLVVSVPQPSRASGIVVLRDGRPMSESAWGIEAPVDPGHHRIEARAPGFASWSIEVDVPASPGSTPVEVPPLVAEPKPLVVAPAPTQATPPPRPAPPPGGMSPLLGTGIALSAAGGATLVVGIATGVEAYAKRRASEHAAPTCTPGCSAEAVHLNNQAKAFADASTATFVIGTALAATGITLVVVGTRSPSRSPNAALSLSFGAGSARLGGSF